MKLPSTLNSLEEYFYWDDFPAYPNTFGCRLHFSGQLNTEGVEAAAKAVSQRNPLLGVIAIPKGRKVNWAPSPQEIMPCRMTEEEFHRNIIRKFDLLHEPGSGLHWHADQSFSVISLLTHHAVSDGKGALQLVFDWMNEYASFFGGKDAARHRRIDVDLLNGRGSYGFFRWKFLKRLHRQLIGVAGIWEFLRNRPSVLKPIPPVPVQQPIPDGYPGILSGVVAEVPQLQGMADAAGVTTNDWVVTAIFSSLAEWRLNNGFGREDDLIRVMVPFNMRQIKDRYLPAANRISLVSIDRRQSACRDFDALMRSIRFQMDVIQKNDLGYTFLHVLNLNRWMPGGIARLARTDRVAASVLVTNLGEPFKRLRLPRDGVGRIEMANLKLQGFDLIAPLRPNTQVAFAIFRYAGNVMLSMTYDNRVLDEAEAQELFNMTSHQINRPVIK